MHLAEAHERGVRRAVLSAANPTAARAYTAIGFQRIGDTSMILFDGTQQVDPCPV
jgi:predicted GNAT family acetyltransferase